VVAGVIVALACAIAPVRASAAPNLSLVNAQVVAFATGLSEPTAMTWRTGDVRMYVGEQTGKIRTVGPAGRILGTTLDLSATISHGNEQGVLGIVFSADGTKLYVDYTNPAGDIQVVEWTMNGTVANLATRRPIITIKHPVNANHNGGQILFGPDGMLYIGTRDGGGAGDVPGNAQNKNVLLGKILRIDPHPANGKAYQIPPGNPFPNTLNVRPEIWMYGVRNPWRYTFDTATKAMWIGDVGQNLYEEVDYAPAGLKGTNWGWNKREGNHPYNGGLEPPGARDPVLEPSHANGNCAVTGGYVYRGSAIANLNGAYVFGDFCNSNIRAAVLSVNSGIAQLRNLGPTVSFLTTFGQAPDGELYLASRSGTIYKLVSA
jgi:glucose/arabinose dehydrogenase